MLLDLLFEFLLNLVIWCLELIGIIAYYTLKGLWYVLRYIYQKLRENRGKVPSLLRYDKKTNDLEVLK